jgi:hypothetical protein
MQIRSPKIRDRSARKAQAGIVVLEAPKWRAPRPPSPSITASWWALDWRRRQGPAAVGDRGRFGALLERYRPLKPAVGGRQKVAAPAEIRSVRKS